MKKIFFLVSGIVLFSTITYAQKPAKAIYAEFGGPGLASVNYDMRFKKEKGFGFRAGIGGFDLTGNFDNFSVITVPVAINYITSRNSKHYVEVGAGVTYVNPSHSYPGENFNSTFGHVSLGYRYAPLKKKSLLLRAAITPVFGDGFFLPYFGGVSIGYKF
jgi:hypothetical protein